MRTQTTTVHTGKKKKWVIPMVIGILVLAVLIAILGVFFYKAPFNPPDFAKDAVSGTPQPDGNMNYGTVEAPTGFRASLCGTMYQQEDGSLVIDFTNPESNSVNIQCEIKDKKGDTLFKSGVIKPGEYIKKLSPLKKIQNVATPVSISIYGYEKDTWYSSGTIKLQNTLQPY